MHHPSLAFTRTACLAIGIAWSCGAAPAQSWAMFQSDISHTGYLPITVDIQNLRLRWSTRLGGRLSPPTMADGRVFVSSWSNELSVVDSSTGALLWNVRFPSANSVNPPSYAYGNVYVQTGNHSNDTWLRCYDAETGNLVFRAPHAAQWERYYAPTVHDGAVYVDGGSYGGMYAFDAFTGAQLWFRDLLQYDQWTPAVDDTHAFAYVGGTLSAVDRFTGAVDYTITDPNFSWAGWSMNLAPILGGMDDVLFIHGGRLVRLDLVTKSVVFDVNSRFSGQPAVRNGAIYAIAAGDLEVRDQVTGQLLWIWENGPGNMSGTVAVTDSHVFVSSQNEVYMIDLTTHDAVWSYGEGGEIAVSGEALYIARGDGFLTAIEFGPAPTVSTLLPAGALYTAPQQTVTIKGANFTAGTNIDVRFDDNPATDVVVVDDSTLTCLPPALGPGVVDVAVRSSFGRGTLRESFAYRPAMQVVGQPRLGTSIEATFHCQPRDQIIGLIGVPPLTSIALPPLAGSLEIAPFLELVHVPFWPFPEFTVYLPVPNDPSLRNAKLLFQGLAGPDLTSLNGAFSNTIEVTIQ